jgi:hypothetical protein
MAIVWLVAHLVEGTWVPVRGFVIDDVEPPVVRWFGEDHRVGEAELTAELRQAADARGEIEFFTNPRRRGSARLFARSPLPRFAAWSAFAFAALGILAVSVQLLLVAIE